MTFNRLSSTRAPQGALPLLPSLLSYAILSLSFIGHFLLVILGVVSRPSPIITRRSFLSIAQAFLPTGLASGCLSLTTQAFWRSDLCRQKAVIPSAAADGCGHCPPLGFSPLLPPANPSSVPPKPIPPVKRVVCTKAKSLMNTSQRLKALAFTTFKPIAFATFAAP